jgi:hypothetical protein
MDVQVTAESSRGELVSKEGSVMAVTGDAASTKTIADIF